MNCRKGEIIEYDTSSKVIIYSFHLDNQEFCEFARFIDRFNTTKTGVENEVFREGLNIILAAIDEMVKHVAGEDRFRTENNVRALPTKWSNLRLYCIRLHNGAILLCNGGIKTSQKLQDSPDCYPHYELAAALEKQITQRIQNKEMWWDGDFLNGDFYFELGDCD